MKWTCTWARIFLSYYVGLTISSNAFHACTDSRLESNMIQHCAFSAPSKSCQIFQKELAYERISDKTFVETSSFLLCIPFQTTEPKSQPVIYYLKIIHKMFALFEGISNKLLALFPSFYSFHSWKWWLTAVPCGERAVATPEAAHLCCLCGKKPCSESSSLSKTRGKYLSGNATRLSLCMSGQN